jgi:inosine-uridine nucleoside N-ribohydrolase
MPQFGAGKPAAGAFFDSGFTTIDDLLAVSLLYGLQGKGDCRVAIVTMSRPNLSVAGFVDAAVRFYHGPAGNFSQLPPVGMRTEGPAGDISPAFTVPFEKKRADGTPVYRNTVKSVIETGDPATLIRNYLEAQTEQNAFMVLSGPASNLVAALDSPGVKPLIGAKVKYLVVAGGAFPNGPAEAHLKADVPAAKRLFAEWPTPIFVSGAEVGAAIEFPGASIDKQFAEAVPDNPVADAYRAYKPMPYDAPSLALTAALYAARPKENYFKLSGPGTISIDDQGRTSFTAAEKGRHQHLVFDPEQKEKITAAYVELASAKPEVGRRFRPPVVQNDKTTPPPAPPKK